MGESWVVDNFGENVDNYAVVVDNYVDNFCAVSPVFIAWVGGFIG